MKTAAELYKDALTQDGTLSEVALRLESRVQRATRLAKQPSLEVDPKSPLENHFAFQQALFPAVLRMMIRGVAIDFERRKTLRTEIVKVTMQRQEQLNFMAGHLVNARSSKQLMRFFHEDLKLPGIKHLKENRLTMDSSALETISNREPLLMPFCQTIAELRTLGIFLSTYIDAKPDVDNRMRCSFAVAGPTTYRFASSTNAFDSGMNMQTLPEGAKQKITTARDYISLPNIRELFIPDPGFEFFDLDLDRADLQVVVWEADDADLKMALRRGLDMHIFNAMAVYGFDIPIDELVNADQPEAPHWIQMDDGKWCHPNYPDHKKKYAKQRQFAKQAVHATNYGVGDRRLAMTIGISVLEASRFRAKWFAAHPGIVKWHKRVEEGMTKRGFIENKFGARLYNWGRLDLPEALAWGPQSTVAGVINRGLLAIDTAEQAGEIKVQLQLQVHDSLGGQFPQGEREASIVALRKLATIAIPYDDPLVIPVGINTSTESWGKCK